MKLINKFTIIPALLIVAVFSMATTAYYDGSHYFTILKNIDLYTNLYKELNKGYVDEVKPAKLMRVGLDAMLKSLDPYTNYISEGQIEGYRLQQRAQAGIGAELIKKGDFVIISSVAEGLAAQKSGLMPGDKIISVGGESAKGRSVNDVKNILSGKEGTNANIQIKRSDQTKSFSVKRSKTLPKSVPYYGMLNENIAYINLKTFLKRGCSQEVVNALKDLQKKNEVKGLVFDVRYNGGGLLNESISMVNIFAGKDQLVVSTKGKIPDWNKEYKTKGDAIEPVLPLVVLTNGRSASASEILSGAIQDLDRGVIIGQRTFGKGLVQQTRDVPYNSKLKLTVAKYYLPSDRCIQAIDYSGRYKDGSNAVPDSLRKKFKTKNGRTVYDGGGVDPDVAIPKKEYSPFTTSLLKNYVIFDYATEYQQKNASITDVDQYEFSESDFSSFAQFFKQNAKNYKLELESEELLKKLKKSVKEENYEDVVAGTIQRLEQKIEQEKQNSVQKFKAEIKDLLKKEIVSRYFFQKGRVKTSLNGDAVVQKAIEILENEQEYKRIITTRK